MPSKCVRFTSVMVDPVAGITRPLSKTEAWSLYHFETHARQCPNCYNPIDVHKQGRSLCHAGRGLALDVSYHVYYRDGLVYSTHPQNGQPVRVEVPHAYGQLTSLLKAVSRGLSCSRSPPVVSYGTATSPLLSRRATVDRPTYTISPATAPARTSSHRHSLDRKYDFNVTEKALDDNDLYALAAMQSMSLKDRRGTLYARDMQRKYGTSLVEIREPAYAQARRRPSAVYV